MLHYTNILLDKGDESDCFGSNDMKNMLPESVHYVVGLCISEL